MKRYHLFTLTFLFLFTTIFLAPQPTKAYDDDFDSKQKERSVEDIKERKQENREKFQEKLKTITDDNKRDRIEKINEHFEAINKRYTNMLLNVLSKYEAILARIIAKTSDLAKGGTNTASIDADITDAEFALDEAKDIISKQADTDYTVSISSEATLKQSVLATRAQLHTDLKTARESVRLAHDAIKTAAQTLQDVKNKE